jgi:hypothetical protein
MTTIVVVLAIVAVIAVAAIAMLLVIIAGIHGDEGHMSLAEKPRTRTRALARWVLSGYATPTMKPARRHEDSRR